MTRAIGFRNAQTHPLRSNPVQHPRGGVSNMMPIFFMALNYLLILFLYLTAQCRCTNVKINFREKEKEVLDQILGIAGRYDARIRPSGTNGTGEQVWLASPQLLYLI